MGETDEPAKPAQPDQDDTTRAKPDGLDAGGHEAAPPSEDPVEDEARNSIQDAFDNLQALHPDRSAGAGDRGGTKES